MLPSFSSALALLKQSAVFLAASKVGASWTRRPGRCFSFVVCGARLLRPAKGFPCVWDLDHVSAITMASGLELPLGRGILRPSSTGSASRGLASAFAGLSALPVIPTFRVWRFAAFGGDRAKWKPRSKLRPCSVFWPSSGPVWIKTKLHKCGDFRPVEDHIGQVLATTCSADWRSAGKTTHDDPALRCIWCGQRLQHRGPETLCPNLTTV